jgi:hypothetical protein
MKSVLVVLSGILFGILAVFLLSCLVYHFVPCDFIIGFLTIVGFFTLANNIIVKTATVYFKLLVKIFG